MDLKILLYITIGIQSALFILLLLKFKSTNFKKPNWMSEKTIKDVTHNMKRVLHSYSIILSLELVKALMGTEKTAFEIPGWYKTETLKLDLIFMAEFLLIAWPIISPFVKVISNIRLTTKSGGTTPN